MARIYAAALLDISSSGHHIERLGRAHSPARHLDGFLTDLVTGASGHTRRAYRGDLIRGQTGCWGVHK
ncbi:hypothetical protein GCM10023075_81700 [Streptosporangium album]